MPQPLPLTSERLERHGLFLIEDGQTIFLWVGRDAVPQLIMDVFNLPSYEVLRGGKVRSPPLSSPLLLILLLLSSLRWMDADPGCVCDRRRCRCSTTRSRSA